MANKGSPFEREFCKDLSQWWTGKRTDVFWRTGGSGGRATMRTRRGQSTFGQYGDVCATDPIGVPLLDLITFELKRGYSKHTIMDLCDRSPKEQKNQLPWEEFLEQVTRSWHEAGSVSWAIVQRRDKRVAFIYFPALLFTLLQDAGCWLGTSNPFLKMRVGYRLANKTYKTETIYGMTLVSFFNRVKPSAIQRIVDKC